MKPAGSTVPDPDRAAGDRWCSGTSPPSRSTGAVSSMPTRCKDVTGQTWTDTLGATLSQDKPLLPAPHQVVGGTLERPSSSRP